MVYRADIYRLLISCPTDVPIADLAIVNRAVSRWNVHSGQRRSAVIVPVWWATHAAAEFGGHPQEILYRQLADDCDMCLAIFANRLGTPTPAAESGTADEIQRFVAQGKYVGILRSRRMINPSTIDHEEAARLERYLTTIRRQSIVLEYEQDIDLSDRVDSMLHASVPSWQAAVEHPPAAEQEQPRTGADVSVRLESRDRLRTFADQRTTGERDWSLAVSNVGDAPAFNLKLSLEPDVPGGPPWTILGHSGGGSLAIEQIAPQETRKFHLLVGDNASPRMRCTMRWSDAQGRRSNAVPLRLE